MTRRSGRRSKRAGQGLVDRLNASSLDPELLMGAMTVIAEMEPEDRQSFEGRTFAVVRYVAEQNLPEDERTMAVMAIGFRLEALARLTVADVPSWRVSGAEDGADLLHEDVIRCAAEEPLVPVKDNMTFDSDSFHRRLLGISDPAGEA